jgi:hypothetical protein
MPRSRRPQPDGAPAIARNEAIVGFVFGMIAAVGAVLWQVAVPLGVLAIAVSWLALTKARGRDARSVGFGVAGLATGIVAVMLGVASALVGTNEPDEPRTSVLDGIESSTPDDENPPQKDLEPGTRCTVDLNGLRAEGAIVNRTDRAWRYSVTVSFDEGDDQIAVSSLLLDAVDPGARATFRAASPKTGTAATTCRVASIDRLAP